jgi:hypothetical protein
MKLLIGTTLFSLLLFVVLQGPSPNPEPTFIPLGPDGNNTNYILAPAPNSSALVVNMIPKGWSDEASQNSDPFLARSRTNGLLIAAANFPTASNGGRTQLLSSSGDGSSWNSIALPVEMTRVDSQTYSLSGTDKLYGAVAGQKNAEDVFSVIQLLDITKPETAQSISKSTGREVGNQPFIQTRTSESKEEIYVGELYLGTLGNVELGTAAVRVSIGGEPFKLYGVESRTFSSRGGQDAPAVRTALAANDRTVYVAFLRWSKLAGSKITGEVVITRDDHATTGPKPFSALIDAKDNLPGRFVEVDRTFLLGQSLGQQPIGADLALAVDPRQSDRVYLCWGDDDPVTKIHQLHLRVSFDRGQNWSNDLLMIPSAINPALAVSETGVVGFLYQQLTSDGAVWETHFRQLQGSGERPPIVLSSFPTRIEPKKQGGKDEPYLGYRLNLISHAGSFYGTFSAPNNPESKYFPQGVSFQREYGGGKLFSADGKEREISPSIDPYFFRIMGPGPDSFNMISPTPSGTPASAEASWVVANWVPSFVVGLLVAAGLLVWSAFRVPKKVDRHIDQRLKAQVIGLINFSGFLTARYTDIAGNLIEETKVGTACFLKVIVTKQGSGEPWQESIELTGGHDKPEVDFRVVLDSSDFTVKPERALLAVPVTGAKDTQFELTAPDKPGDYRIYVQLYQRTTLVQVIAPRIKVNA